MVDLCKIQDLKVGSGQELDMRMLLAEDHATSSAWTSKMLALHGQRSSAGWIVMEMDAPMVRNLEIQNACGRKETLLLALPNRTLASQTLLTAPPV